MTQATSAAYLCAVVTSALLKHSSQTLKHLLKVPLWFPVLLLQVKGQISSSFKAWAGSLAVSSPVQMSVFLDKLSRASLGTQNCIFLTVVHSAGTQSVHQYRQEEILGY